MTDNVGRAGHSALASSVADPEWPSGRGAAISQLLECFVNPGRSPPRKPARQRHVVGHLFRVAKRRQGDQQIPLTSLAAASVEVPLGKIGLRRAYAASTA
jgi:hypothetical protein